MSTDRRRPAGRQHGGLGEHPHSSRSSSRRSLWTALALISAFMLAELVGGLLANSLALLADAGHMLTDSAAIGLALLATWMASRPASARRTFGFQRTEILAAFLNALSLWLIAGWIFYEAAGRFREPQEVQGAVMLGVGAVGLVVNVLAAWVLKRPAADSLNVEGAFLHILGDLLGSVAVIIGGLLVITLDWHVADPIFGVLIGALILFSSGRLLLKAVHVLLEGTPSHLDIQSLCQRLEQVDGVTNVHDIHAWSITTGYEVLSAHVTMDPAEPADPGLLLQHLRGIASVEFNISHVTIQLEDAEDGCEEAHHIVHGLGAGYWGWGQKGSEDDRDAIEK